MDCPNIRVAGGLIKNYSKYKGMLDWADNAESTLPGLAAIRMGVPPPPFFLNSLE